MEVCVALYGWGGGGRSQVDINLPLVDIAQDDVCDGVPYDHTKLQRVFVVRNSVYYESTN